jgi:polyisoprenoid-binding protein YceI/mono/diheme cytochrome c family protein
MVSSIKKLSSCFVLVFGVLVFGLSLLFTGCTGKPELSITLPLEIVSSAPAAPKLEPTATQTLYRIDTTQSEARYNLQETILAGLSERTVVGKSQTITGDILVDLQTPANIQLGAMTVNLEQLTSDSKLRDNRLKSTYLESSRFPTATFIPESLVNFPETLELNKPYTFQIQGDLTLKDITAKTTWDVTLELADDKLIGTARTTIYLSNFKLGPIRLAGFIETSDAVTLELNFVALPDAVVPTAQSASASTRLQTDVEITTPSTTIVAANAPEFFKDIKPILEENCVACHSSGQIGHGVYSLEITKDAATTAEDIALVTRTKYMPPWPPSEKSPALKHARTLTSEQIESITAWANAGAPVEGLLETPLNAVSKEAGVIVRNDRHVTMENPYISKSTISDDYRCFIVDPKLEQDAYITGYAFEPGNLKIDHHMILFFIPAESRARAEELASRDTEDGWSCFGDTGIDNAYPTVISWTPGEVPIRYAEGTGIRLPKGTLFVLQMHYNLSAGIEPDQSGVALELSNETLNPVVGADMFAPVELPCPANDKSEVCKRSHAIADLKAVEPNTEPSETNDGLLAMCGKTLADYQRQDPSNIVSWCDFTSAVDGDIVTVYAHMHTLGRTFQLLLNPDSDKEKILLDIPHWSFSWQSTYTLQNPISLKKGDTLRVICSWDNSPKIAGISPQLKEPLESFAPALGLVRAHDTLPTGQSRYVIWGEGTKEEMCIGSLGVLPTAEYTNVSTVVNYPSDAQIIQQVVWLRLQRQLYWLIPLVVVLLGSAALIVWRVCRKSTRY